MPNQDAAWPARGVDDRRSTRIRKPRRRDSLGRFLSERLPSQSTDDSNQSADEPLESTDSTLRFSDVAVMEHERGSQLHEFVEDHWHRVA